MVRITVVLQYIIHNNLLRKHLFHCVQVRFMHDIMTRVDTTNVKTNTMYFRTKKYRLAAVNAVHRSDYSIDGR